MSDNPLLAFDSKLELRVQSAAAYASASDDSIVRWCRQFGIGRKVAGRCRVSRPALAMLLADDQAALIAYQAGDRTSPTVVRYLMPSGSPRNDSPVRSTKSPAGVVAQNEKANQRAS